VVFDLLSDASVLQALLRERLFFCALADVRSFRVYVYEFTVNFGFDSFTMMFLIPNGASIDHHIKEPIDMLIKIRRFLKDQSGSAAVEYGLITSGISIAVIPSVNGVGNKLVTIFTQVQNAL
jgi:Flp pilus assembly pilin Flp